MIARNKCRKLMKYQKGDLGFCTEDTGWPLRTQSNAKLKSLIELSNNMVINFKVQTTAV